MDNDSKGNKRMVDKRRDSLQIKEVRQLPWLFTQKTETGLEKYNDILQKRRRGQ